MICPKCRSAWVEPHPYCPSCGWGGAKGIAVPERYQDLARIMELEAERRNTIPKIQDVLEALRSASGLLRDYRYGLTIDPDSNDQVRQRLQDSSEVLHYFLFS